MAEPTKLRLIPVLVLAALLQSGLGVQYLAAVHVPYSVGIIPDDHVWLDAIGKEAQQVFVTRLSRTVSRKTARNEECSHSTPVAGQQRAKAE